MSKDACIGRDGRRVCRCFLRRVHAWMSFLDTQVEDMALRLGVKLAVIIKSKAKTVRIG